MADREQAEVVLEPVDIVARLDRLELSVGQVCRLAGVSRMQLDYWTKRARIPTRGRKQRLYDMAAVEVVMLIKQGRDRGLALGGAIDAARHHAGGSPPALRDDREVVCGPPPLGADRRQVP